MRQRWTSPNGRVHSSLLTGVRYVKIVEDFQYVTNAGANTMTYRAHTSNDLVGFQVGGDILTAVIPRLKFGAEAKAGVFSFQSDTASSTVVHAHVRLAATSGAMQRRQQDCTKSGPKAVSQNNMDEFYFYLGIKL